MNSHVNICHVLRAKSHLVTVWKLSVKVELPTKCQKALEDLAKAKIAGNFESKLKLTFPLELILNSNSCHLCPRVQHYNLTSNMKNYHVQCTYCQFCFSENFQFFCQSDCFVMGSWRASLKNCPQYISLSIGRRLHVTTERIIAK